MSSLFSRIYGTEAVHRAVPWPVAASAMERWAARIWDRDAGARADAMTHMRVLLGATATEAEVAQAARRYVTEVYYRYERWFRPWLTTKTPPQGIETLAATLAAGRGAVVNFMHYGEIHGPIGAIGRAGIQLNVASLPVVMDSSAGPIARQIVSTLTFGGVKMFPSKGSSDHVRMLLKEGSAVAIASDVPSATFVSVLGRSVGVASGAARLAKECGALVFPLVPLGVGRNPTWRLDTPIEPADYDDPVDLLREMMRRHEPGLRRWPEALEKPLRRWTLTPEDQREFGWSPEMTLKI